MVYSYYSRLNESQKRTYRRSDALSAIPLTDTAPLQELARALSDAIAQGDRPAVEDRCRAITAGLTTRLKAPPVRVRVLAARPSASWGELHGLYEGSEGRSPAVITLWMRTAKHRRIVAFRTFFRTLLHELCHHLDYEVLRLPDSFHTAGFYQRESSLFRQIMGEESAARR